MGSLSVPGISLPTSRRDFLTRFGCGTGLLGLNAVLADESSSANQQPVDIRLNSNPPAAHFAPRAKRVIHLLMNGGPSQMDTFDYKPSLAKYEGQRPATVDLRTQRKTTGILKSPFRFTRHGESGLWVSELFPHVARHVDELCVIQSMHTDIPEHVSGLMMMDIGANQPNRPSMGSWITWGLGTENANLPGFVVLCHNGHPRPGPTGWSNSFLPGSCAGTFVDTWQMKPDQVLPNLRNLHLSPSQQRQQLGLLQRMNQLHLERTERNQALETRIESLELAFRMQFAAPDAFDISRESRSTLDLYGIGPEPTSFVAGGRKCGGFAEGALIARRLLERGVRVVQLAMAPDVPWDDHSNIHDHRPRAFECDRPIAALLTDLKQRGLLDETLVLWGGEFGRTPTTDVTAKKPGRDHNHYGFTVWLAGGGVKGGMTWGATDEFGMRAIENRMHVHDLHATILHLMGLNHERLTFRHSGRDFRLTDVKGTVAQGILT